MHQTRHAHNPLSCFSLIPQHNHYDAKGHDELTPGRLKLSMSWVEMPKEGSSTMKVHGVHCAWYVTIVAINNEAGVSNG